MSYLKTKQTDDNITDFLNAVENEEKKNDSFRLLKIFSNITKLEPKLWGNGTVGFGNYTYKTKANKTGEWFLTGFSPRKSNISLHLMFGLPEQTALLSKLGKHKIGKGCLYINKLSSVDLEVLEKIIANSFQNMKDNS